MSILTKRNKELEETYKNKQKFTMWKRKLDFNEKLKFGLEIEVDSLPIDKIRKTFKTKSIVEIMKILDVPDNISKNIIKNAVFEKKGSPDKWVFSEEAVQNESEVSTPILTNNLNDLNQIAAICTLFKAMGGKESGITGLHINIAVDYLECNKKAIHNLLRIWGECEEIFYKIANQEGKVIRSEALNKAVPIKENVQKFFERDGSIKLQTEEDMDMFLYQIQARNRMEDVTFMERIQGKDGKKYDLKNAKTDQERFEIYRIHSHNLRRQGQIDDNVVRYTSINFNHMKWNEKNSGRIELRLFNSSLEPVIIFQDLLLVGKLFEVSLKNAKNSNYKKKELENLCKRNVTEEQKVDNLLNLLFERQEQKQIFKKRWQSVKEKKEYKKYRSGKDTFDR